MTIVLHSRKIAFLKAKKVAGTSFEFALSSLARRGDVVVPTGSDKERKRHGISKPMNYRFSNREILFSRNRIWLFKYFASFGFLRPLKYTNHMSVRDLRRVVGIDLWSDYFKISIARNPYSVVASIYYYIYNNTPPSQMPEFSEWLFSSTQHINTNHQFYYADTELDIDFVLRFEHLADDLDDLCSLRPDLHQLRDLMVKTHVNKNSAKHRKSTAQIFSNCPEAASIVYQCCHRQFRDFGYSYDPMLAD